MMRQVVLDTETTGLDWKLGDRVVEIGCVELIERRPTGRTYQVFVNPERAMNPEASAITKITDEFLADKPLFAEIVDEFLAFVDGAEVLAHNAEFDIGFLDNELDRLGSGYGSLRERVSVVDTQALARQLFPGKKLNLNALCRHLGVDISQRTQHGALLDAKLLTQAYLAMTSGQGEMGFASDEAAHANQGRTLLQVEGVLPPRPRVMVSADALHAHAARLQALLAKAGRLVWQADS